MDLTCPKCGECVECSSSFLNDIIVSDCQCTKCSYSYNKSYNAATHSWLNDAETHKLLYGCDDFEC